MFNNAIITLNNSVALIVCIFLFGCFFFIGLKRVLKYLKSNHRIVHFADYSAILEIHMEKAYNMIHKDRILIYSLEATKVPEEQINTISKDFINLTEKLLGPNLLKEFIFLYGDYEAFVFTLAEFFNSRYEEDEIRKESMNNLMESEQTETP